LLEVEIIGNYLENPRLQVFKVLGRTFKKNFFEMLEIM
jgi:hypothetical protein